MKKQVCMVAYTNYVTDNRIRREAETLVRSNGYTVTFLTPKKKAVSRMYQLNGVDVVELNVERYIGKVKFRYLISYILFLLYAFLRCARLFAKNRIDVIHIHNMPNFLVFAGLIPRIFGKTLILDVHDTVPETYAAKFDGEQNAFFRLLCLEENICCRFAHKIICVNHPQRDLLVKRGIPARKITVSLNVPDHRIFGGTGSSLPKSDRSLNLVYHGTQTKRLGVDIIIQAVDRLRQEIPETKLTIIGEGEDAAKFIELTRQLKLEDHILFKGTIPVNELPPILKGMDIGIVANRKNIATELMLPVKMLEYVALNIPVVAPRLRTIQYYFSEDMLTYFEPESVESLVQAILILFLNEQKKANQIKMARRFIDQYGWEKHHLEFLDFYGAA